MSAEYPVTYKTPDVRKYIEKPGVHGVYWVGIPEEGYLKETSGLIVLNGSERRIETIGFQGSSAGYVEKHPEPNVQEDVFVVTGDLAMALFHTDGRIEVNRQKGIIEFFEMELASFVLATATDLDSKQDHLVLNVEVGGQNHVINPMSLEQGGSHASMIAEPSVYFVVKHRAA